jgi:ABC-type lipoprotein export system ATPase subunit
MLISAKNLFKTYHNSLGGASREVLKGLSLEVKAGEKIAIMGPSGSGKTTLLNLLGTLDTADNGEIVIAEKELNNMSEKEIMGFRNKTIGFVFQSHHLLPQCTLFENVMLPTLPHKGDKQQAALRAEELLKYMGVWEQRNNKPGELSGGECQRAAVARALINEPDIILADEPTGSLDAKNALLLTDLLSEINVKMNVTLIIATHSSVIADKMDRVYVIKDGKL